jgi:hypothetical protein
VALGSFDLVLSSNPFDPYRYDGLRQAIFNKTLFPAIHLHRVPPPVRESENSLI